MGLNLKDTKGGGTFEPIPSGRYNVKVSNAEIGKTLDKKDVINLTYTVTAGPQNNKKFFDKAVITPNSLWKLKTLLTIANSSLAESNNAELSDIVADLKDAELSVHVEVTKNEDGKPQYQCSGWQKTSGTTTKPTASKSVNILQ